MAPYIFPSHDSVATFEVGSSTSKNHLFLVSSTEVHPAYSESCPRTTPVVPEVCGPQLHEELARTLSGRDLNIPSLQAVLASWPSGVNVHLERLRPEVDKMLASIISDPIKLKKVKACDFAFLAACCFSDADWEWLNVAAAFLVWIFIWDDEIDQGEEQKGDASCNEASFCSQSRDFVQAALGLGVMRDDPTSRIPSLKLFAQVAEAMCSKSNPAQRRRVFRELDHYITEVQVESEHQTSQTIPTVDDYIRMRIGTSGIAPGMAFCEMTTKARIPVRIIESPSMRTIWQELTMISMLTNDLYSLPKELKNGIVESLVPVIFFSDPTRTLDEIVQEVVDMIVRSMDIVDREYELLAREAARDDEEYVSELARYIDGCKRISTGLVTWMIASPRYGIQKHLGQGSDVSLTLSYSR